MNEEAPQNVTCSCRPDQSILKLFPYNNPKRLIFNIKAVPVGIKPVAYVLGLFVDAEVEVTPAPGSICALQEFILGLVGNKLLLRSHSFPCYKCGIHIGIEPIDVLHDFN